MMRSISVPAGRSKTSDTPWFSLGSGLITSS
jgi:hypothetical protein